MTINELRTKYGKPLYNLDKLTDASESWEELKRQAAAVESVTELRRHASVSTSNAHFCHSCFCCACVTVLEEMNYV